MDEGDVAKVLTWTKISAQLVQHCICKGVINWPISATDSERDPNMNVAIKWRKFLPGLNFSTS